MVTKEEALLKKTVVLEVTIAGIRQKHEFFIEPAETALGRIPFLVCKRSLPINELLRVSNEVGLPAASGGQRAFPNGKGPKDFLNLV